MLFSFSNLWLYNYLYENSLHKILTKDFRVFSKKIKKIYLIFFPLNKKIYKKIFLKNLRFVFIKQKLFFGLTLENGENFDDSINLR